MISSTPKLTLHFDVNKILINQVAEDTIYRWDEGHPKMSYREYVDQVVHSDLALKKLRRKIVVQFLEKVNNIVAP